MADKDEVDESSGGAGASGGGPYPNPHSGKDSKERIDGYGGHGGQSEVEYHGSGRLGKKKVGANPNAPAHGSKPDPR